MENLKARIAELGEQIKALTEEQLSEVRPAAGGHAKAAGVRDFVASAKRDRGRCSPGRSNSSRGRRARAVRDVVRGRQTTRRADVD